MAAAAPAAVIEEEEAEEEGEDDEEYHRRLADRVPHREGETEKALEPAGTATTPSSRRRSRTRPRRRRGRQRAPRRRRRRRRGPAGAGRGGRRGARRAAASAAAARYHGGGDGQLAEGQLLAVGRLSDIYERYFALGCTLDLERRRSRACTRGPRAVRPARVQGGLRLRAAPRRRRRRHRRRRTKPPGGGYRTWTIRGWSTARRQAVGGRRRGPHSCAARPTAPPVVGDRRRHAVPMPTGGWRGGNGTRERSHVGAPEYRNLCAATKTAAPHALRYSRRQQHTRASTAVPDPPTVITGAARWRRRP